MPSVNLISRREFLAGAAVAAGASILAACAPAPTPTQAVAAATATKVPQATVPPATPVPTKAISKLVQYWFGWGGQYGGAVWDDLRKTDEFKEALGDNTLETKGSVPAEGLLASIAAGTPPDGASCVDYLDLMARGVTLPVADFVAASKIIKQENYFPTVWNDSFYKGTMLSVPANEGFLRYALNYNAKLVGEAGLDPDKPPLTWEECLEWHKKLTSFDKAGNLVRIGLDPYDAMGGSLHIANGFFPAVSWGWKWFDDQNNKFDLDNDKMAQSLEMMGEFIRIIGPDKLTGLRQVEGQGGWGGAFNAEVQAMIIEGYWHPGETVNEKPEVAQYNRASWAPVPGSRSGVKVQGTGGHYFLVFKQAKSPDLAFKVAELLNTKVAMDTIFKYLGWLPSVQSYVDSVDPKKYPGLEFYFKSIKEATEWSSPARCPISNFVQTAWNEEREAVYRNKKSNAQAAKDLQSRCEQEWEKVRLG